MNVGDRVRLLTGTEEGIVTRLLDSELVEVAIDNDFTIPVLRREVVVVAQEEGKNFDRTAPDYRVGQVPGKNANASKKDNSKRNEFGLYSIHQELQALCAVMHSPIEVVPLLGSVSNIRRLQEVCVTYRPHCIYHAAAYKHVPMVESNPSEGIANNVFGTLNVARAALAAGVANFVLVSTDKAVRPTNIMGASKRMAELVLQALSAEAGNRGTRFCMVRFGNVLGSSGSVVPLFRAQLASGGPLTVTHPEVTRYFMTIPEAAQLVLHAGAMAVGGEVFVLDMGEPVKIMDLAQRMIQLSGLQVQDDAAPDGDIAITITGLRPGEKLFEELLIGDNPSPTAHTRIMKAHEEFLPWPELEQQLRILRAAVDASDVVGIKSVLQTCVHGYAQRVETTW